MCVSLSFPHIIIINLEKLVKLLVGLLPSCSQVSSSAAAAAAATARRRIAVVQHKQQDNIESLADDAVYYTFTKSMAI